jgi:hypothetical protein
MNLPFKCPKLKAQPPAQPYLPEVPAPPMPSAERGPSGGVPHLPANAQRARPGLRLLSRETGRGI